jgi:PAP2 superfamily
VTASALEPRLDRQVEWAPSRRLRWWKEALFVIVFYAGYTVIRDIRGSKPVSKLQAFHNAHRLIGVERFLGIFHEQRIQHWFLADRGLLSFMNVFYGTAHFAVTIVALVWLFRRQPERYPLWRNTLAFTTALALLGFAFFPLMPPRLLPDSYHFVDTLKSIGGLWSFDSGAMNKVSNQYAAMPSLHFGWSSWCALVLAPAIKPRWGKALVYAYPVVTLFCIVVTANHYILDAAGGAVVLGAGLVLALALTRTVEARDTAGLSRGSLGIPRSARERL